MPRYWGFAGVWTFLLVAGAAAQQPDRPATARPERMSAPAPAAQPDRPVPSIQERMSAPAPTSIHAQPRWNTEQRTLTRQPNQPVLPGARGQSVALMVAGGALFVAGAVVGDDAGTLLMVGGAVLGAYGLYLYFR